MKKIYVTVSKQKIYIEAEDFFQFKDASVYDYKDGSKELKEDLAYINEHGKRRLDCLDSKQSMESLKKQFQDVLKTVCRYRTIKDVKPLSKHKGAEELERRIQNEQIAALLNQNEILSVVVIGENKQSQDMMAFVEELEQTQHNIDCCHATESEAQEAEEAGLGYGKYRAYLELKELDPDITTEEAANMTMRELYERIRELEADGDTQTSTGTGGSGQGKHHHHGHKNE